MNRMWIGAAVSALLLTLLTAPTGVLAQDRGFVKNDRPDRAGVRRVALVIGNGRYADSPLTNPSNDAKAVAGALEGLGFEVLEFHDLDQRGMKRAILSFGERLDAGSIGLFYYAGHGMQVQGRNYLIPIGAQITGEADTEIEAVDVAAVLAKMENAHNRLNIVILDACRNNPFARSWRSTAAGLAMIDAPNGTLVAYATSPGRVAADGEGANGVYTESLIKYVLTPGLRIEDVFKRVRTEVREKTSGAQIPWESSSLEGDFYFVATADKGDCPAGMRREGEGCVAIVNTECPERYRFQPGSGCVPVVVGAVPTPPFVAPPVTPATPERNALPAELAKAPQLQLIERRTLDPLAILGFKGLPIPAGALLQVRTPQALNFTINDVTAEQLARFYWSQINRCKGTITRVPSPYWGFSTSDPKCSIRGFSVFSTGNQISVSLQLGPDEGLIGPANGVFGESLLPNSEVMLLTPTTATFLVARPVEEVIVQMERRYKTRPVRIDKGKALGHDFATLVSTSEDTGYASLSVTRNPQSDQPGQPETSIVTVVKRIQR